MIKIYDFKGYKYIGSNPTNKKELLRDNLTYISFSMTKFNEDIKQIEFLSKYHTYVLGDIEDIKSLLTNYVEENKLKRVYIIIKQNEETDQNISIAITNKKPNVKEINRIIKQRELRYQL